MLRYAKVAESVFNLFTRRSCLYRGKLSTCTNNFFSVRCVSTNNTSAKFDTNVSSSSENNDEEYVTIYANPGVRYFAIINRAIWVPTVAILGCYPISLLLYAADFIALKTLISALFVGTYTCLVLHGLALNIWRKVGFLYVNKDMTKLKVGYVSYWGKRNDVILPVSKIMAFSDMYKSPYDYIYYKVKTFDSKHFEFYKLDKSGNHIVDRSKFNSIFGSEKL